MLYVVKVFYGAGVDAESGGNLRDVTYVVMAASPHEARSAAAEVFKRDAARLNITARIYETDPTAHPHGFKLVKGEIERVP